VFPYGFNLKMLKYIKRRCVVQEEDSENESKLLAPSTSKAEKEVTDKKFAFTMTVIGHWFCMAWRRKLAASILHSVRGKTVTHGCGTGKVKSTLHN
jgi:hypothetical protein